MLLPFRLRLKGHVWTAPAWQDVFASDDEFGRCGHVSGLCVPPSRPLAQMESAGSAPIQVIAFNDAEPLERVSQIPGFNRFVINPLAPHQSLSRLAGRVHATGCGLNSSFFVNTAHTTRAVLAASATAPSLQGLRASKAVAHLVDSALLLRAKRGTACAPITSRRWI